MPEVRRCPQCGAEVPPDAPAGVCPRCVLALAAASQPAGSEEAAQTTPYKPGAKFVPPAPAELVKHFPQLDILELIGQGGMGAVYKARQRHLNRLVAVKILPPEVADAPGFAERFQREAQALAQLSHPHIVAVYDFGASGSSVGDAACVANSIQGATQAASPAEHGGLFYFLMEYVDGVNLRQLLRDKKLPPGEALAIVPQICEALQFAHDEGIVHRDIKPENILMDKKGRIKIADFGLAKLLGRESGPHTLTGSQQVMGTPHYMAPEQMERPLTVDHRADIYSLGVVFYEMLTGELPLGRFAPPSEKVQIDVRLDEVVLRSLEKEPERRYQHASEVQTDVETIKRTPSFGRAAPPSTGMETTSNEGLKPITLLEATSGWKSWLPIFTAAAGLIGILMLPLAALAGGNPIPWLLAGVGLVLLGLTLGFLLTIRWTVEYRGHRIAFEYNSPLRIKRLIIDGRTAAAGGMDRFFELRATIKEDQGVGDEIVCTVEAGFSVCCQIIALPKTPSAQEVQSVARPEFAKGVATPARHEPTPVSVAPEFNYKAIQSQLILQAKGVIISGVVGVLLALGVLLVGSITYGLGFDIQALPRLTKAPSPFPWWILMVQLTLPVAITIIVGGENMYRLHSYGSAVTAAILAMLPCHLGWFIGLPAGSIAILVLKRPEVKAAFLCDDPRMQQDRPITRENIVFSLALILVVALISGGFLLLGGRGLPPPGGQVQMVDPGSRPAPPAATSNAFVELDTLDAKQSAAPAGEPFPPPTHVAFSGDGKTLIALVGLYKHSWELEPRKDLGRKKLGAFIFAARSGTLAPDGKTITLVRPGGDVELWAIDEEIRRARVEKTNALVAVFSPDEECVAVAPRDARLRIIEVRDGWVRDVLPDGPSLIRALAFSPDGGWMASGDAFGDVWVRLPQHNPLMTNKNFKHEVAVTCLALEQGAKRVAAGFFDGTVLVWDVATRKLQARLGPHPGLSSVAFAPDGRLIATGSTDGTVKLWTPTETKTAK